MNELSLCYDAYAHGVIIESIALYSQPRL